MTFSTDNKYDSKEKVQVVGRYGLRSQVFFLGFLSIVAAGMVLHFARGVVMPLVVAWLISYIFKPMIRTLERKKIPPVLSIAALIAVFLGLCLLALSFLYRRLVPFANAFPSYYDKLLLLVQEFGKTNDIPTELLLEFDWGKRLTAWLITLPGTAISLVSNLFLMIVFLVFILLGSPTSSDKLNRAFSPKTSVRVQQIIDSISKQIGRYLTTAVVISAMTGIAVWMALKLIGVDFSVNWGVLAFLLNFIPYIGSILASIPPILVALVKFYPDFTPAIITAFALLSIQVGIGNLLAPKVMGDALDINPIVVLVSLLFWGWLWGGGGAVLAVPIAVVIKIVCENIPSLHPVAIFMSSK